MNELHQTEKLPDLIYDVGMHLGEDSDFYLAKGFRVIAFEANPKLIEHCKARFHDAIRDARLVIVEGAIAPIPESDSERKTIEFYTNSLMTVWGTVAPDWADRNESMGTANETITVPRIDFGECLRQFGIPHYLKIDIEGMDPICLETLRSFANRPDYASIESNKNSLAELANELDLLAELGYHEFKAIQQDGISKQREPRLSKEGRYSKNAIVESASGLFGEDLPGKWKSRAAIFRRYKPIFRSYKLFGDFGSVTKFRIGRGVRRVLVKLLFRPIPGWYDTHARHSSAPK